MPGVVEAMTDIELDGLMENILQVMPETKHVYVTMGTAPLEQFWAMELKRAWERYEGRVETHFLDGLSLAQMKSVVASPPKDSVVFHGIMNRDGAGVTHEAEEALVELMAVAKVPSFGYSEGQLGLGIMGGRLLPLRESAQRAATAAVRLLDGEDPAAIELEAVPLSAPVYDWRELQRWGIAESALPAGSTVRHRVPTLWQEHRGWVVGAGLVAGLPVGPHHGRQARAQQPPTPSSRITCTAASVWHGASRVHATAAGYKSLTCNQLSVYLRYVTGLVPGLFALPQG
jgi:hypothetical protein